MSQLAGEPTQNEKPVDDLLVVGGGVSGLTLAWRLCSQHPHLRVRVLEADSVPGGTMRSERVEDCLCEWGPNGFLTNVPHTYDLACDLGLESQVLPAADAAAHRFLYVGGRLQAVEANPASFLRSGVLSVPGRLRLCMEPFRGRGRLGDEDESVHAFASRRIGREAADVLVDAMVAGIHAADSHQLSVAAAFPRLAELEREHGSLTKGMIAARRQKRGNQGGPAGPGGRLTSFSEGMEVLISALAEKLGSSLQTGVSVTRLIRETDGFRVEAGNGQTYRARRVVLAVPAYVAGELLSEFPEVSRPVSQIEYAPITVACLLYNRAHVGHPLDGFGFLVPVGQGPKMLGCIWVGSVFPQQVEPGTALLRVMMGGARRPEDAALPDDAAVDLAHRELSDILGITASPRTVKLFRHPRGIPQYTLGHLSRVRAAEEAAARLGGLSLIGNAFRGIGVNDCVREANALADRLGGEMNSADAVETPAAPAEMRERS